MHIAALDFSRLDTSEERFLEAVSDHLSYVYAPVRRRRRTMRRWLTRRFRG
jgi:hypothetical protein